MYIGSDGRVYQNKFESLGHGTKMPGFAEEQRQTNDRLHALRQRQRDAIDQQQQQELRQQQIDAGNTRNFYDRHQRLDELVKRQYGMSGGNPQVNGNGQTGYGMPGPRTKTDTNLVAQQAGELNRMLTRYQQSQNPEDARRAMDFINQNPGIKANNVSGIRFSLNNGDDNPLVSLLDDSGSPVKEFYLSALSNLNNFAKQSKQTFDPGSKGVNDPGKLMEQVQELAASMAEQAVNGSGIAPSARGQAIAKMTEHFVGQLMKPYQARNPGYMDGPVEQRNNDPGFDLFGPPTAEAGGEQPQQNILDKLFSTNQPAPPPPPPTPAQNTPTPNGPAASQPGYGQHLQNSPYQNNLYWRDPQNRYGR